VPDSDTRPCDDEHVLCVWSSGRLAVSLVSFVGVVIGAAVSGAVRLCLTVCGLMARVTVLLINADMRSELDAKIAFHRCSASLTRRELQRTQRVVDCRRILQQCLVRTKAR